MNDNQQKDEQMQPAIVIHTQYIKDMSLEIPHAPEIFRELTQAPAVDVQVEVNAHHMHDNFHNVSLSYRLNGDINGKKLLVQIQRLKEITFGFSVGISEKFKIFVHTAMIFGDGHIVIVNDNNQICIEFARKVKTFESLTAAERTVTDNGYNIFVSAN